MRSIWPSSSNTVSSTRTLLALSHRRRGRQLQYGVHMLLLEIRGLGKRVRTRKELTWGALRSRCREMMPRTKSTCATLPFTDSRPSQSIQVNNSSLLKMTSDATKRRLSVGSFARSDEPSMPRHILLGTMTTAGQVLLVSIRPDLYARSCTFIDSRLPLYTSLTSIHSSARV